MRARRIARILIPFLALGLLCASVRMGAADKFILHVTKVQRTRTGFSVEGQSKTVKYKVHCSEQKSDPGCLILKAGKDYAARDAGGSLVVENEDGVTGLFIIDSQEENRR